MSYGSESIESADALGHVGSQMASRQYRGMICNRRGEFERAVPLLTQSLELMDLANLRTSTAFNGLTGALGSAYVRMARVSEGLALLEQGRAQSLTQGAISDLFIGTSGMVDGYLAAGQYETALCRASEAVGLASAQGKRGFLGWATHALAEAQARSEAPDLDAAQVTYHQALALAEELQMRPLEARSHLGLGKLLRRVGRADDARSELAQAATMLREMGMAHWLPEAEAELAAASST
jgi:tetratricopeptide (TPR) repeat protein